MCYCFFFKQKTAYEMRISDWSSDVCSSDLAAAAQPDRVEDPAVADGGFPGGGHATGTGNPGLGRGASGFGLAAGAYPRPARGSRQIGRASCRERVWPYVSISVVAVSLKQKY